MSRRDLTKKQHGFLEFLKRHVDENDVWPTYREICDHFGYKSPNSVTQNLRALLKKGYLRRNDSGYHFVNPDRDGFISVRSLVRSARIDPLDTPEHVSLNSFFEGVSGLHALRLDKDAFRRDEFEKADYVLVSNGVSPKGRMTVVWVEGQIQIGLMTDSGVIQVDGTKLHPKAQKQAEVLGIYAGHAGPYGVVRRPEKTLDV